MAQTLTTLLATAALVVHLLHAGLSPFTALVQRPLHLALLGSIGLLPAAPTRQPTARQRAIAAARAGAAVALAAGCLWVVVQQHALVARAGASLPVDRLFGWLTLGCLLWLTWRAAGPGLVLVAAAALTYSQLGPWLPGLLAHRGYSPTRVIEHLYLSTEGIWGVPLGVSADFVYLFVLFGTLLDRAGGGPLLIQLAQRLTGAARGGPAKTAALASALMGSLSGSAVANVVTTGAVTIPLMRRAGFAPRFAAAIEAAASTGGQLMPPVMGAGAFVLATWTGIPYLRVAAAALLPALLYYAALLAAVHFVAVRERIVAGPVARGPVAARIHLLGGLVAVIALLALGRSPMRAAFWGAVATAALAFCRAETRPDRRRLLDVLRFSAQTTVPVAAACASAGIVVGVATLTGIGLRISQLIAAVAGGNLLVGLGLTAAGSIVLGMGLPTTAAYVVLAALGAPALVQLGAPPLAAHLFIFYFGCISNVTPPVALAAYAAAGMAGARATPTALAALGFAAAGFLVPFAFVLRPALLLAAPPAEVALAAGGALLGVVALASAVTGFHRRALPAWERLALAAAAAALLSHHEAAALAGLAVLSGSLLRRRRQLSRASPPRPGVAGLLLAVVLLGTVTGCAPSDRRFASIGTGGTGGIYYPLGGALARMLGEELPGYTFTAEVTGGSVENVQRVLAGQIDLGFAIGTTLVRAHRDPAAAALRVVAPLYPNVAHVLVRAGEDAARLEELAGRTLSVGAAGSGTEQMARDLLAAAGIADDVTLRYLSFGESAAALRDGAIDGAILSVGFPAAAALEATSAGGARLIPLGPQTIARTTERWPHYRPARIPAGTYPGQSRELATVAVMNWIVARDDLPPEVVTALLEILVQRRDELRQVNEIAAQIDLGALDDAPYPLHPATAVWRAARSSPPGRP